MGEEVGGRSYEESIRSRLCRHDGEDEYDRIDDLLLLERQVTSIPAWQWDGAARVLQERAEDVVEKAGRPSIRVLKELQLMRRVCRAMATWCYAQADGRTQDAIDASLEGDEQEAGDG